MNNERSLIMKLLVKFYWDFKAWIH